MATFPIPAWAATRGGLTLGPSLTVSFQRFLPGGVARLETTPTSLGTLEPGLERGELFLVAIHPEEAVWLGVEGSRQWPGLRAVAGRPGDLRDLASGRPAPVGAATEICCERMALLPGLPDGRGGYRPLAGAGLRLAFQPVGPDRKSLGPIARVELVDAPVFAARTGRPAPPPADPRAGYRGWRLP
jgi:hypothetical protein